MLISCLRKAWKQKQIKGEKEERMELIEKIKKHNQFWSSKTKTCCCGATGAVSNFARITLRILG